MIKQISLLFTAAVLLLPAGCTKDPAFADDGLITVEAGIGAPTKVAYDGDKASFAAGDRIAVYAWLGSASEVPAKRVVDGVVNTLGTDGKWTPASLMCWQNGTDAHYFLGVSPVHAISDFTADEYAVAPAEYTASDLLFAANLGGVKAGDGAVKLAFRHAMAKMKVNLSFRDQFGGTPEVSTVTLSAKTKASVNYLTQTVSATGEAASVSLPAETANSSYSGLMVPQEGVRKITVTIGGKGYVYEAGEDIPLASGQVTTVNLVVGRDKLELASGITIADWTDEILSDQEAVREDIPLTIEAAVDGAQVRFDINTGMASGPVWFRTWDGSAWSDWTDYHDNDAVVLARRGDKVQFKGDNARYAESIANSSFFSFTEDCYAYGNVMSLITSTDYETATALTEEYALCALFYDSTPNVHLLSHPSEPLRLPATSLSNDCYEGMFTNCLTMTTAPELPATVLAEHCYDHMFYGCNSLSMAPQLPATTLADHCYAYMFAECHSLTSTPELPAATLVDGCYNHMFTGCMSLTSVTCLATDVSATGCTSEWLSYVATTGTRNFITPASTAWSAGISGIPDGWTRIDYVAP